MPTTTLAHRPRQGIQLPQGEQNGRQLIRSIENLVTEYAEASSALIEFDNTHERCYSILLDIERIDDKQKSLKVEYDDIRRNEVHEGRSVRENEGNEDRKAFLVHELEQLAFNRRRRRPYDHVPPFVRVTSTSTDQRQGAVKRLRELKAERSNSVAPFSDEDLAKAGTVLKHRRRINKEMDSSLVNITFTEASPVDLSLRQKVHESLNTRRKASPARRQRYVQALRTRRTPLSDVSSVDHALSKAFRGGDEVSRLGSYRKAGIYA